MNGAKETVCLLCAECHLFSDCVLKMGNVEVNATMYRCTNCVRNKLNDKHSANSLDCPSRAKYIANRAKLSLSPNAKAKTATKPAPTRQPRPIQHQPVAAAWTRKRSSSRGRQSNSQPRTLFSSWFKEDNKTQLNNNQRGNTQTNAHAAEENGKDSCICMFMAKAYERIMAAEIRQEQRRIAFEILASS